MKAQAFLSGKHYRETKGLPWLTHQELDNDTQIGRFIDATSYFELEAMVRFR